MPTFNGENSAAVAIMNRGDATPTKVTFTPSQLGLKDNSSTEKY